MSGLSECVWCKSVRETHSHLNGCCSDDCCTELSIYQRGKAEGAEEVRQAVGWRWIDKDTAFAMPFGTIRACRHCGCLTAGGPTACVRCVKEIDDAEKRKLMKNKLLVGLLAMVEVFEEELLEGMDEDTRADFKKMMGEGFETFHEVPEKKGDG